MPRPRERILASLEPPYREPYARAGEVGDEAERQRLDPDDRRGRLRFEPVLDVRDLLAAPPAQPPGRGAGDGGPRRERIGALRSLTRLAIGR